MPNPNALSRHQRLSRRQALAASLVSLGALLPMQAAYSAPGAGAAVKLTSDPKQTLFRVRMELEFEGNVNVPNNPLVSRKGETKLPVKSNAVFDYEERFRRPADADLSSEITTSERFYHEAASTSRLDRSDVALSLRESLRHTIVRRDVLPEVSYGVDDYFTQQELDLVRVPLSSITIDRVLPQDAVTVGDKYAVDQQALVSVLNLASIQESDVLGEVVDITEADAKIQLRGKVSGSTEGVPTVVRVIGKLTFDRKLGTCTWLAMAIHETREIGKAEPGFDIAATIKMIRKPLAKPIQLPLEPVELAITEPIPQDKLYVSVTSDELGVSALVDRRWRLMSDVPG